MNDSLKAQCVAEFLGTGLFLFFGIGCLCALKLAGASLGLWEICIIWGLGISGNDSNLLIVFYVQIMPD
ncbi:aquaporin, partial [Escherichia coli]|uniref:aquaporin n=1 Tax=Escherichia coli TaxID=562 RepID=UPI0024122ED7